MNFRTYIIILLCLSQFTILSAKESAMAGFSSNEVMLLNDTTIFDTLDLGVGEIRTRCLDTSMLTGAVDTIFNECSNNFSPAVSFLINKEFDCSTTIKYEGITCGTDTACFVICDVNGICLNQMLIVSALEPSCFPTKEYFFDTLYVTESRDFCIDLDELSGNVVSFENVCPQSGGSSTVFSTFEDNGSFCINYSAVGIGVDTACLVVTDDRGFTDTTCVIIASQVPKTSFLCDTIPIGTDTLYCFVNDEIGGNTTDFLNVCPQSADTSVIFAPNDVTLCVETQAIGLGTDTACIIICNENDICDTTILKIVVVPDPSDTMNMEPPIAINDTISTDENTPLVVINIIDNDTIPGEKVLSEILTPPVNGTAVLNADCMINYIPNQDFCGADSLEYRICNNVGCDTAWVIIDIACMNDSICIFNGISPNGDNANDTWIIKGIENFPNNHVEVYNRWGNIVFEMDEYRGTWLGDWNGVLLPSGTYFYVVDLGDGRVFRNFLQINR